MKNLSKLIDIIEHILYLARHVLDSKEKEPKKKKPRRKKNASKRGSSKGV